jgi:hypothetical protein
MRALNDARISIPLMVDAVHDTGRFQMTRMTYFSIAGDRPSAEWILEFRDRRIPFLMINLSGIICRPDFEHYRFDSAEQIDALFDLIEADDRRGLLVDLNDVWLPNSILTGRCWRADVYRIDQRLFAEAWHYRHGRTSLEQLEAVGKKSKGRIHFSEKETEAFRAWSELQISQARKSYPKSKQFQLSLKP